MRNIIKIGIIALLGVILLCFHLSYAALNPVGRVVWVKGTFKAIAADQHQRTLKRTSVIYVNDTLVTDDASQAEIVFTDNTLMTFRPDTKFYIDQYQYQPKAQRGSIGKYVMNLIEGGFRTITGIIAKENPQDYRVNTPVATIGVRGTDYAVYVSAKGELYIGYYEGTPCLESKKRALCLSNKNKYGYVPYPGAEPVYLLRQPDVLKQKLLIVPARIAPTSNIIGPAQGGTVSSFCIR